jgi:hypothetical protein
MTNGGFLMESKKEIYELIPKQYYPKTVFLEKGVSLDEAIKSMLDAGLRYPFIAKPDIGGRGRMVSTIRNDEDLCLYIRSVNESFMLQEFVEWENEAGIFYYRYPGAESGCISGIVAKEFLAVTGNGKSSMEELLQQNKRFVLQLPVLKKMYGDALYKILPSNEKIVLVPFGNHIRGSKFIDVSNEADEALTKTIDGICKQIKGFYFGRMDIKFNTWEELKQGKNFSIIELNGAGSEPTHIYDPAHSIFFAWKEIIRHWNLLAGISRLNHIENDIPYMTVKEGLKMFRDNKAHLKKTAEQ